MQRRQESLVQKLKRITVSNPSENVVEILSVDCKKIQVNLDYNADVFGFSPADFVLWRGRLMLCVGVTKVFFKCTCDFCVKSNGQESLLFLSEDSVDIISFGYYRKNDFQEEGFLLIK